MSQSMALTSDDYLRIIGTRCLRTASAPVKLVVCDLSAAPYLDLAGARMLHDLHDNLAARAISFRIVGAHDLARDLLRAEGVDQKVGGLHRSLTLDGLLTAKQS
jgi:MFS superfamily sulfate permease-like transporter